MNDTLEDNKGLYEKYCKVHENFRDEVTFAGIPGVTVDNDEKDAYIHTDRENVVTLEDMR